MATDRTTRPPLVSLEDEPIGENLRLREREVERIYDLAELALRGTLTGAIAVMVMVVAIYAIAAFSGDKSISGWHILGIVGVATVAVVAYGAYVFQRAASMTAKIKNFNVDFGTGRPSKRG